MDTWYFITVDYTFGKRGRRTATSFIKAAGGKVLGSSLHPLNATDFSSHLLQAQASGAKVIGVANSGSDFANLIKQARNSASSAASSSSPRSASMNAVHGIGLDATQGLIISATPHTGTRTTRRAPSPSATGGIPRTGFRTNRSSSPTAPCSHYLKAVAAAGTDEGEAVMAKMRELPVNDFEMKNVAIRADGQVMRQLYAARIKTPAESKYPYDYYEIVSTVAATDAWRPASESVCSLLKTQ